MDIKNYFELNCYNVRRKRAQSEIRDKKHLQGNSELYSSSVIIQNKIGLYIICYKKLNSDWSTV